MNYLQRKLTVRENQYECKISIKWLGKKSKLPLKQCNCKEIPFKVWSNFPFSVMVETSVKMMNQELSSLSFLQLWVHTDSHCVTVPSILQRNTFILSVRNTWVSPAQTRQQGCSDTGAKKFHKFDNHYINLKDAPRNNAL